MRKEYSYRKWGRVNVGKRVWAPLVVLLAMVMLLAGCGNKATGSTGGAEKESATAERFVRTAEAGGIEIRVAWLTPEYLKATGEQSPAGADNEWLFEIAMTTHSGDLTSFNMLEGARLRVDGRELAPIGWELTENDAHHPVGILRFPRPGNARPDRVELVIANLGGVPERVFAWEE